MPSFQPFCVICSCHQLGALTILTVASSASQGAPQTGTLIHLKNNPEEKRMKGEEAAEFPSTSPAKPQTSHLQTGDTGTEEELSRDRGGKRAGFVSITTVENHISWAPQSHLDIGTEVLNRAPAISLSRPRTNALRRRANRAVCPTLKDLLNSEDYSVFI